MKSQNLLLVFIIGIGILITSCGGGSLAENKYLGKLPAIAKKYQTEISELKEKAKQATDMDDAFKYNKEYKLKKEEADKAFDDYMATAEFANQIIFDNNPDYKFEVVEIIIDGASRTRVNLKAKVKINEDIKNEYGGNKKYFFAYFKALDKEGNMIGRPSVMSSSLGGGGPYVAGMETELSGSLEGLSELIGFEKIVFISKEEYKNKK
jgi:hypothetical protein